MSIGAHGSLAKVPDYRGVRSWAPLFDRYGSPSAFKRSLGVLIVKKHTPLFHQGFSVYSMGTSIDFFAILATAALLYAIHRRRKPSLPFPPGPKGLPLVGNLFQVPSELEWMKYHEWSTELSKLH